MNELNHGPGTTKNKRDACTMSRLGLGGTELVPGNASCMILPLFFSSTVFKTNNLLAHSSK